MSWGSVEVGAAVWDGVVLGVSWCGAGRSGGRGGWGGGAGVWPCEWRVGGTAAALHRPRGSPECFRARAGAVDEHGPTIARQQAGGSRRRQPQAEAATLKAEAHCHLQWHARLAGPASPFKGCRGIEETSTGHFM